MNNIFNFSCGWLTWLVREEMIGSRTIPNDVTNLVPFGQHLDQREVSLATIPTPCTLSSNKKNFFHFADSFFNPNMPFRDRQICECIFQIYKQIRSMPKTAFPKSKARPTSTWQWTPRITLPTEHSPRDAGQSAMAKAATMTTTLRHPSGTSTGPGRRKESKRNTLHHHWTKLFHHLHFTII